MPPPRLFEPRAQHIGVSGSGMPADRLHDLGAALARENGGHRIALIDGQPHQFVAVPLRSPLTVGWVVMGFPLGEEAASDMRALSGLHVVMQAVPADGPARLVARTFTMDDTQLLPALGQAGARGTLAWDDDELVARRLRQSALGGELRTLLMHSGEVAAPLHRVQLVLGAISVAGLLLFALGSVWTAHHVTTPLRALVRAAERLGRGDDAQPVQGSRRRDEIGELARAFEQMRSNIAAHQAELRRLAYTDRLTGLPNRAHFRQVVDEHIRAARSGSLAVIVLDLDRFKHVNDVLGYASGDLLLGAVAERLTQDVVRRGDLVARLGGDEFALMLPGADIATALAVADRMASRFALPLTLHDQTVGLSAGVGIACWPAHAADADTMLARAEVAMYGAKQGSDAARVYDPSTDAGSAMTLSLLPELRHAVEAGELPRATRRSCARR